MRHPIKGSIAALLAVAVIILGIQHLGGPATGVAWGEVVSNIEASPGFIYRMQQTQIQGQSAPVEFQMQVYNSARHGVRMDTLGDSGGYGGVRVYVSLALEEMVSIMPQSKTYTRQPLSRDQLAQIERMKPETIVRDFLAAGHRNLGRRTIRGVEAEGVEVTDLSIIQTNFPVDSFVGQLWVARDTDLPVLLESTTVGKNGELRVHTVQDQFHWHVDLDASEFEPQIPADCRPVNPEVMSTQP